MKDLNISKDLSASRIIVNKQRSSDSSLIEGEINSLKAQISKTPDNPWNGSVLQVLFNNEAFARKYRVKIEKFLKDLLEEGEEFIVCHPPHNNGEQDHEDNHQSFHIDSVTCESNSKDELKQNIPHYSSHFEDTLSSNKTQTEEKPAEEKPSMFTCFNCLGNHHLKECPEKMDRLRINANRKDILSGNSVRYHTEEQNNSLKAGILSNELRTALGLRKDQLPQFIYHMRVIGYPPGWMDDAVLEKSGLSLYDTNGKDISIKPTVSEEKSPSSPTGTLYDGSKFVEFPGFNTPVPNGFVDEWKTLAMPSLQPHQQLKEALKSPNIIFGNNTFKRRQFPSADDLDSKKSKNVDEALCSPQSNEVSKRDSTCHHDPALNFDFKTPDSKKSNKRSSMSISKSPGTPILEQGNPYQKLPAADKFAQGITEHLPFENLPDAVGTYEKMRGVISCVQKKLNDIQSS